MDTEDILSTIPSTSEMPEIVERNEVPVTVERPLSPFERITSGAIDGRPVSNYNGKLDALLIAISKTMKLLAKDKLLSAEKCKAYKELERITTDDIRRACEDVSLKTMRAMTSFEECSRAKIKAPKIQPNASNTVSANASKDFAIRINNGYFAHGQKYSARLKDILSAVVEVVQGNNLSFAAAVGLLRRALRDPARQFMEYLLMGGTDLAGIFDNLQENYNTSMSSTEAAIKLRKMLSMPIENLDQFLSDLLDLSIISIQDNLPASEQTKAGFIIATSHLVNYISKQYSHLASIVKYDLKCIQSAYKGKDSEIFLNMMKVLRLHRESLETGKRSTHNKINEISEIDGVIPTLPPDNLVKPTNPMIGSQIPQASLTSQEIRDIIRDEIRPSSKPENTNQEGFKSGDVKNIVQEIVQGILPSQNPMVKHVPVPVPISVSNPSIGMDWGMNMANYGDQEANQLENFIQANQEAWAQNMAIPNPPAQAGRPYLQGSFPRFMQGQNPNYQNRFVPQMMQRATNFFRAPFGGQSKNPNYQPLGNKPNADTNPRPNEQGQGARRNFLPVEMYKHFAQGRCFVCGLQGHSFRECTVFGPTNNITDKVCPDCEKHNIVAFHNDCHGKNFKVHHNLEQTQTNGTNTQNQGAGNQVSEIDLAGLESLGIDPSMLPVYCPEMDNVSKNA